MPDANGKPLRADANTPSPLLSKGVYDILNDAVTLAFPLFVTAYAGLGVLFLWPDVDKWVAAAGIIGVLLGGLLKIARERYAGLPVQYDGELIANDPNPDADTFRLSFNTGLAAMSRQDTVRLKVVDLLPKEEEVPVVAEEPGGPVA